MTSTGNPSSTLKSLLPEIIAGVGFFILICVLIPFTKIFEFNSDEGVNLAKGLLVAKGYPLYSQIWSDQPPLMSWMLGLLFRITGPSVVAARALVLFFATCLLISFFSLLRSLFGIVPAVMGILFLTFSSYFAELSVSVMIGLVSLSFFMMSARSLHSSNGEGGLIKWAFVSGVLAALSLSTKFFTAPLVVLLAWEAGQKPRRLKPWLIGFSLTLLPVVLASGSLMMHQIFSTHIGTFFRTLHASTYYFSSTDILKANRVDLCIATLGIYCVIRQRAREYVFPLLYFAVGLLVVFLHHPLFYHHCLLMTVPMAWMEAIAVFYVAEAWRDSGISRGFWANILTSIVVGLTAFFIFDGSVALHRKYPNAQLKIEWMYTHSIVIRTLVQNRDGEPWLFTDRPMYAFRAGLLVPPEIAVLSDKRMMVDNINGDFLTKVISKYDIHQVLMARLGREYSPEFMQAINSRFDRFPPNLPDVKYFVRSK